MAASQAIAVSIPDGDAERSLALKQLSDQLAGLGAVRFAEIWVDHDPFPSLCALVHDANAWLMYIRYDGDAGFSSRNPAYAGDPHAKLEFYLSNGQRDVYPASWCYPTQDVVDAVRLFAVTRKVPAGLVWYNDSGDGTSSPNDTWVEPE
jgi:hypothetical protein